MKPSFDPEALFALPAKFGGGVVKRDDRAARAKLLGRPQVGLRSDAPKRGLSMLALRAGK